MTRQDFLDQVRQGAVSLAARRALRVLGELAASRHLKVYLVGGTVRELALGRPAPDLDLAVSGQTLDLGRDLAAALGGTFVLLDAGERTARVVWQGEILDLAQFRAPTLEEDLKGRDFTLNALALDLEAVLGKHPLALIDPWGGLGDLAQGTLRVLAAANLAKDPLRLLRAYRFAATHGFRLAPETVAAVRRHLPEFSRVAGERVHQELFLLLGAPRAAPVLQEMDQVGLLTRIFPELADLRGVEQNGFHHLDVFQHTLETLGRLEEILAQPQRFFRDLAPEVSREAVMAPKPVLWKLAALFHDAGKAKVRERRHDPERYTFYYHERVGLEIFERVALRLRLSQAEFRTVTTLIRLHMRPFLLLPVYRRAELSLRALGRLVRAARPEFVGLFTLAMADSLAGQGPLKPPDSDALLADLAEEAYHFLKERVEPQERLPKLVSGHDLVKVLGLKPGPQFRRLLGAVQEAQWEGLVQTREEALELVRSLL